MTDAMSLAKHFGAIEEPTPEVQAEIERLSREPYLEPRFRTSISSINRLHIVQTKD